jgi:hypothetical protein
MLKKIGWTIAFVHHGLCHDTSTLPTLDCILQQIWKGVRVLFFGGKHDKTGCTRKKSL